MKHLIIALTAALALTACTATQQLTRMQQYQKMYEEKPAVLLVMPPINNTNNVDAKELLYTSISRPLIEAGYYVIPPLLAMDLLKAESAYDAELFVESKLTPFKNVFGCDAVVFSVIDEWTKIGFTIQTKIRYMIKSAHTGEMLFDRTCKLTLNLQENSGFALGNLIASAINTALTEEIEAARKANYYIFTDIPRGKYSPDFGLDGDTQSAPAEIETYIP